MDTVHNLVIFIASSSVFVSVSMVMSIDMLVNVHIVDSHVSHLRCVLL